MKKVIFPLLLIMITGFSSCDKGKGEGCHPEEEITNWNTEKEIMVEYQAEYERNYYTIIDGDKLVFEYNHSGAQCDSAIDDEWGERLIFQIEANLSEFDFADDQILSTNCFYQEYGAWVNHVQQQVKNGTIRGEKIAENKWEITVNIVTTPSPYNQEVKNISFTKVFVN